MQCWDIFFFLGGGGGFGLEVMLIAMRGLIFSNQLSMGGGIGAYYRGGILIEIARPDWVQVNIIQIA